MVTFEYFSVDERGPIAVVSMNRPPVNAFTQDMYRELDSVFSSLPELAPQARVAVLMGVGPHFCAGNDLNDFATMLPENAAERMQVVREAFWAVYDSTLPVIAAVQGSAVGTGLAIAASCDLIVAADTAEFALPEISVGVMGGARHLARLVPQGFVRGMHLTADRYSAHDLSQFGGIYSVVVEEELETAALSVASRIARHSPVAIRMAKRSLNAIESMALKQGYEFEQSLTCELSAHPDSKEAVAAFFDRRAPHFSGA